MSSSIIRPFPKFGLYAITPDLGWEPRQLADRVAGAIAGGAQAIQLRCKEPERRQAEAEAVLEVCRNASVPVIINDDVELAFNIQADGVHLGKDDSDLAAARKRLGPNAIIGVSCYDSLPRACEAQVAGASYIAFGRFFPSRTKPHAPCAQLATLQSASTELTLPIVAIGGITPDNARTLLEAGAQVLAVIDAVFGESDTQAAARRLRIAFREY